MLLDTYFISCYVRFAQFSSLSNELKTNERERNISRKCDSLSWGFLQSDYENRWCRAKGDTGMHGN